jgi:hypothetical protein
MLFLNNYFTKNSEEVVMANKLYKVDNDVETPKDGSSQEIIANAIKTKENFTFGAWLQFRL